MVAHDTVGKYPESHYFKLLGKDKSGNPRFFCPSCNTVLKTSVFRFFYARKIIGSPADTELLPFIENIESINKWKNVKEIPELEVENFGELCSTYRFCGINIISRYELEAQAGNPIAKIIYRLIISLPAIVFGLSIFTAIYFKSWVYLIGIFTSAVLVFAKDVLSDREKREFKKTPIFIIDVVFIISFAMTFYQQKYAATWLIGFFIFPMYIMRYCIGIKQIDKYVYISEPLFIYLYERKLCKVLKLKQPIK